jgi:hypothetical protein
VRRLGPVGGEGRCGREMVVWRRRGKGGDTDADADTGTDNRGRPQACGGALDGSSIHRSVGLCMYRHARQYVSWGRVRGRELEQGRDVGIVNGFPRGVD